MNQAAAETITVGQLGVRFLVECPDSNGSVSVFECYVPANAKMPAPHSHDAFEETIYGLKGATTWTVDGETIEIGVGEALCVPRGAIHGFQNGGSTDATFLAIASPGVFGPAYFERSATSWRPPPAARRTSPRWRRSCSATGSRWPSQPPPDPRPKATEGDPHCCSCGPSERSNEGCVHARSGRGPGLRRDRSDGRRARSCARPLHKPPKASLEPI